MLGHSANSANSQSLSGFSVIRCQSPHLPKQLIRHIEQQFTVRLHQTGLFVLVSKERIAVGGKGQIRSVPFQEWRYFLFQDGIYLLLR